MNLALIALTVTDEKTFDIVDEQWTDGRTDGRTDDGTWPSYKLTFLAFGSTSLSSLPFS